MTEASATTDPTKLAPPKKPWNRRLIKALKVSGVLLTLTCLGTCYWWFFLGWGKLTDENLQRLRVGMCLGEVQAIIGHRRSMDYPEKDESHGTWINRHRWVTVYFVRDNHNATKLTDFNCFDLWPTFEELWQEVTAKWDKVANK